MVKRYEQPDAFLYDGRQNSKKFFGNFDIREFIVEENAWNPPTESYIGLARGVDGAEIGEDRRRDANYAVLRGPLKVAVSTEKAENPEAPMEERVFNHTTEIVTIPFDTQVRFVLEQPVNEDLNMGITPHAAYSPVTGGMIGGGGSAAIGGVGTVATEQSTETIVAGTVGLGLIGSIVGWAWEKNKFSSYGVERLTE